MSGNQARPAPLFVDAFDLAQWLQGRLGERGGVLADSICTLALELLDAITLALKDRERELRLEEADELLLRLRNRLRLAGGAGLLDQRQMLFALERADQIGRQIGGWWRKLHEG